MVEYRIVSVAYSENEISSGTFFGWRLGTPDKPSNVNATYETHSDKIILDWDDSGVNNLYNKTDYFTILRSKTNVFSDFSQYETVGVNINQSPFVDYIDQSEDMDVVYWYVVIANNEKTENFSLSEYNEKTNWSDSVSGKLSSFFNLTR